MVNLKSEPQDIFTVNPSSHQIGLLNLGGGVPVKAWCVDPGVLPDRQIHFQAASS